MQAIGDDVALDHLRHDGAAAHGLLDELVHRSSTSVPAEVIDRIYEECLAHFSAARIRDFVPVLAQRCAKANLATIAAERATPSTSSNGSGKPRNVHTEPQAGGRFRPAWRRLVMAQGGEDCVSFVRGSPQSG